MSSKCRAHVPPGRRAVMDGEHGRQRATVECSFGSVQAARELDASIVHEDDRVCDVRGRQVDLVSCDDPGAHVVGRSALLDRYRVVHTDDREPGMKRDEPRPVSTADLGNLPRADRRSQSPKLGIGVQVERRRLDALRSGYGESPAYSKTTNPCPRLEGTMVNLESRRTRSSTARLTRLKAFPVAASARTEAKRTFLLEP